MTDFVALSDRFVAAYNAQDFDKLGAMMAPDLDFAHYNRDFALSSSKDVLNIMRDFARDYFQERKFSAPLRVTAAGNIVAREAWFMGVAKVPIPGFAPNGGSFKLMLCSVLRFNDRGIVAEWKDYG